MSAEPLVQPKAAAPELFARAPRPPVVRIRRSAALAAAAAAALIVGAALAWALVIHPELRARAQARASQAEPRQVHSVVQPSPIVADQPATYDRLPPPRSLAPAPAEGEKAAPATRPQPQPPRRPPPQEDAARELRQAAVGSGLLFEDVRAPAAAARPEAPAGAAGEASASAGQLRPLASPDTLLAGTIIPAALLSAVDTARPGPVIAAVTADVYDTVSGRRLLVPQGARLIGRQSSGSRPGETRVYLEWTRLILPDGASLTLEEAPAVDAEGAVGAAGRVRRRIGPLALASVMAGAITTLGQAARDHEDGDGILGDAGDAAAIEAAQAGGRLIDRELAIPPSIRLRAGAAVRVLVVRDLVLEPYRR